MTRTFLRVFAILGTLALCTGSEVRAGSTSKQNPGPGSPAARCVAIPLPSLRGADGNSTELAAALRDLVSSFLTGPSLRTVALEARLAAHAQEELRQKNCGAMLIVTLTRKKSGGGVFGKVLGDAAGAAAWHMPYGGSSAASTAARSAAIVGATAASSMAQNTRAKDELQLEYRLVATESATPQDWKDQAKAKADGEDLVTPLVERMATVIAAAVTK